VKQEDLFDLIMFGMLVFMGLVLFVFFCQYAWRAFFNG